MGLFSFSSKPKPVRNGAKLSAVLTERGYVHQHTGTLEEVVDTPRTFYWGVDPSADSMHVGQLMGAVVLRHFIERGHKLIVIVGGGTGMVGDPGGKSEERNLLSDEAIKANTEALRKQFKQLFRDAEFEMINNADWLRKANLMEFLRDVGKHFTVNEMIKRDSVRPRIETPEQSISFTEFSYMLLQAYDYLHLHEHNDCTLQVGASDQWGNIVSGVDLIRRRAGATAHAFCWPLLVNKSTGKKFGKSEGGAIWLDPAKTSPFEFYQFWFNTDDSDVEEYLLKMTLLPKQEIDAVMEEQRANPSMRAAQKKLAAEVTMLVHGVREVEAPTIRAAGKKLRDIAGDINLSMSELRRLVEQKGITLNGTTLASIDDPLEAGTLRVGKQRFYTLN
ncbi:MAG: tyrosine--tRNA ligase [Patescibacteria group bacterium]